MKTLHLSIIALVGITVLGIFSFAVIFSSTPSTYVDITIIGLGGAYAIKYPIDDFSIKLEGYGYNPHPPEILVKNSKNQTVWDNKDFPSLVFGRAIPGEFCEEYDISDIGGPIILNSTGEFRMIVSFEQYIITREFKIRENVAGVTVDRVVPRCG